MLVSLNQVLNEIFDNDAVLKFSSDQLHYDLTGGGSLSESENVITLSKTSLMTYLYSYAFTLCRAGFKIDDITNWAHTIFCLASRWTYFDSRNRGLFFHTPGAFVSPLANACTFEEVDAAYTAYVSAALDENLVPLTAKVDGD